MTLNKKQTSDSLATLASKVLKDPKSSATQKKLAGSAMAQSKSSKQTSSEMEQFASSVLQSEKYSDKTKSLAGTVLSQSNKDR
ncbi:MAG: hypothetical protein ACR2PT_06315 [Endozoicomonas sp.]